MATRILVALAAGACIATTAAGTASAAQIGHSVAVPTERPTANRQTTSASGCPAGVKLDAGAVVQEQAMLCLTNAARADVGAPPLEPVSELATSAEEKAGDLLACDEFSHYACGREFVYWIRDTGYLSTECWRVGENLAWGAGDYGTVDAIFRAWMRSPEHRKNILGDYRQTGIDLKIGNLGGLSDVHVWTQHFGSHCDS